MLLTRTCIGSAGYVNGMAFVHEAFSWSWAQMMQFSQEYVCKPGEYIEPVRSVVNFPPTARNELVDRAKGDWLLMLDADHEFEPDLLMRLLDRMQRYNVDVVVGIYHQRFHPYKPILYHGQQDGYFMQIGEWPEDEPFRIGSAGGGCLMCKTSVYGRIKDELGEGPFSLRENLSEDHSFFMRCHELDIPVLCDPRIQHPHLTVKAVTSADYDREFAESYDPASAP